jgi:hypothetical protein
MEASQQRTLDQDQYQGFQGFPLKFTYLIRLKLYSLTLATAAFTKQIINDRNAHELIWLNYGSTKNRS